MKKTECYNCREISHIKKHCKKFKKNNKINQFEKKNDSSDDNNKKINKKIRKKKFNNNQVRKIRQQQAQAVKNDLDNYDSSNNSNENLKVIHLAVNKFDDKLSEKACYAAENKNETAYQITKTDSC